MRVFEKLATSMAGVVVTLLTLTACATTTETPDVKAPDTTGTSAGERPDSDSDSAASDAIGTRSNPAPAGSTAKIGNYTVSLGATNLDASAIVAAENQFNDPPAEGRQFVLVRITATYNGEETGSLLWDLDFKFVGSAGNTFGSGTDDDCGVIPDEVYEQGELYPGATAEANVCASVPSEQVQGGTWVVEESFTFEDNKVFFALN